MHSVDEEKPKGFTGKIVSFFDIEQDPLVKKFKGKNQSEEEKKGSEWVYT